MREKTGGHTRREVLKMAAAAAITAGVSSEASRLKGEQSDMREPTPSTSAKTVYDLSKLPWLLSGCVPFFDEFAGVKDIREMDIAEVGPIPAPVPGLVQVALLNAGVIEDWNVALNARRNEWVENRD